MNTNTMIVGKIVKESDRLLLYPPEKPSYFSSYHIIAPTNAKVSVGDKIEYESYGVNFGWYNKTIKRTSIRAGKKK